MEGEICLVTGGCSGIGLAFVKLALTQGAKSVAVLDLAPEPPAGWLEGLDASKVLYLQADVSNWVLFRSAFQQAVERLGPPTVVLNNAGIMEPISSLVTGKAEDEPDPKGAMKTVEVNLMGVIYGTALAVKYAKRPASVINVSSMSGLIPLELNPVYTATKHGVVGFTRSVGGRFRKQGLFVSAICPSFTQTALVNQGKGFKEFERLVHFVGQGKLLDAEMIAEGILRLVKMKSAASGKIMRVTFEKGIDFQSYRSMM